MNKIRLNTSITAVVLCLLALLVHEPKAQQPAGGGAPIQGNYLVDNSAAGEGGLISSYGEGLSCNRQKWYLQGENIKVRLSFRQNSTNDTIGSWTVRSIFPAWQGRPETIVAYLFDGRFTGGNVNLSTGSFDLHGTTNYSALCNQDRSINKQVRIWGNCLSGDPINFEVSDRDGTFAHGKFQGRVTCGIGQQPVNTTLDRH